MLGYWWPSGPMHLRQPALRRGSESISPGPEIPTRKAAKKKKRSRNKDNGERQNQKKQKTDTGTAHGASPACPSSENLASQDTTGPQNQPNGVMPPGAPSATATASHDAVATSGMSESTSQPLPIQPMSAMGTNSPDGTWKTATPPGPQGVSSSHQPMALIEEDWIQCDLCNKWRKCSKSTLEQHAGEGKSWECSMNTSNATYASCDAPEEQ